jgi:hypothetical protein
VQSVQIRLQNACIMSNGKTGCNTITHIDRVQQRRASIVRFCSQGYRTPVHILMRLQRKLHKQTHWDRNLQNALHNVGASSHGRTSCNKIAHINPLPQTRASSGPISGLQNACKHIYEILEETSQTNTLRWQATECLYTM